MTSFTFLHAADLHLDSPLVGLSDRSPDFAIRIGQASRRAFERLVDLAIEERCRFVVLAGDVFDCDLRDYRTGLFFLVGMSRLREAGIAVFLITGNHDAENRFFDKLAHTDNVRRFDHRRSHSFVIDDLGVAVHGRSFERREVTENLALGYPPPHPNLFNVGVLHTACEGSEGDHARYAPCTVGQLVNHGYQYWALGHVHARMTLAEHPHVVYPGNLQGRSVRETGPKGATLVHVVEGAVERLDHRDLDEVRWACEDVDVTGATDLKDVRARIRAATAAVLAGLGDRPLALRLRLRGETALHPDLVLDRVGLREDVEAMLATFPGVVWLERVEAGTRFPAPAGDVDPTIAGRLSTEVRRLGSAREVEVLMERCLDEVRARMPSGTRIDDVVGRIRAEAATRAVDLALSLLGKHGGGDAVR